MQRENSLSIRIRQAKLFWMLLSFIPRLSAPQGHRPPGCRPSLPTARRRLISAKAMVRGDGELVPKSLEEEQQQQKVPLLAADGGPGASGGPVAAAEQAVEKEEEAKLSFAALAKVSRQRQQLADAPVYFFAPARICILGSVLAGARRARVLASAKSNVTSVR